MVMEEPPPAVPPASISEGIGIMRQQAVLMLLGEAGENLRGEFFPTRTSKSGPTYYAATMPRQISVGRETVQVGDDTVVFELRGYAPDVLLIETRVSFANMFDAETFDLEERLFKKAHEILRSHGGTSEYSEEYSVFMVSHYRGPPEAFLHHSQIIASLLKSERQELADQEIAHTLQTQIKYGRHDLAIIDWDGAILFDPEGDFEQEIELLTLANLQLLRHRTLDRDLDRRLERMAGLVQEGEPGKAVRSPFGHHELARGLVEVIRDRTHSIAQLQRLEREIKLIGDWYSARFFDVTSNKFKIADWRRTIQSKLESVEDIYAIVAENFIVSRRHRAEWIQIILFFILQVGWLILIVLEFFYFTRH